MGVSPITEQRIKRQFRGLSDGSPDYDGMWERIRTETQRRRSGWSEQPNAMTEKPAFSQTRRWIMAASAAAVFISAGGAALYLGQHAKNEAPAAAAPAGQRIEASAEVGGVKLTLNNAVIGKRVYDEENRLALQLHLSGLENKKFDYAAFKQGTLTDLDSGKSTAIQKTGFDARKGLDHLDITEYVQGNLPKAGETRRYRLVMDDLYLTGRSEVPIAGKIVQGKEYEVLPDRDFRIKLTSYKWTPNGQRLDLNYQPLGKEPHPEDYDPAAGGYEGSAYLNLKNGADMLTLSSAMSDAKNKTQSFVSKPLTEKERDNLQFVYSYAETVGKVKGAWTIDFTLEGSKAAAQVYEIPVKDQTAFEERTGMKMSPIQISPFEIKIPVARKDTSSALKNGQFLAYSQILLEGENFKAGGFQKPVSGTDGDKADGLATPLATIYFDLQDNQLQDLQGETLTLKLRDAALFREYPDIWTPMAAPQAKAQTVSETMPDQSVMTYQIQRKGKDVYVKVRTGEKFYMIGGMRLKVDGKIYGAQPDRIDSGYDGESGYRINVFKNIPQAGKFSINAGSYGAYDPSRDLDIPLQH